MTGIASAVWRLKSLGPQARRVQMRQVVTSENLVRLMLQQHYRKARKMVLVGGKEQTYIS